VNESDNALQRLLDLHNWTAEIGGGFWVCMKVRKREPDEGRPHGIEYALTMHTPGGERILGYDNAHVPPVGTGPAAKSLRRRLDYDHRHWRQTVTAYQFQSPGKLLEDFWRDVEALLKEEGVR
jgi:hypothetical protein